MNFDNPFDQEAEDWEAQRCSLCKTDNAEPIYLRGLITPHHFLCKECQQAVKKYQEENGIKV